MNPFFWGSLFFCFYLILPSFFAAEINYYFSWGVTESAITLSSILILLMSLFVCSAYFFNESNFDSERFLVGYRCSSLITAIWLVVTLYLFWVMFKFFSDFSLLNAFAYDGMHRDPYKLKNLSYLLLPVSAMVYLAYKRFWVFTPNIMITILDLLQGSRTIAFVAIILIYICLCISKRKLYLIQGFSLVAAMLLIGIVRMDLGVATIPWYISAIGEFRETYITLPLMLTRDDYVGFAGFFDSLSAAGIGLLQPFRAQLTEHFVYAGGIIQYFIGRGYGLGSNIITESLFYGYAGFLVMMTLFISFLMLLRGLIKVFQIQVALVFLSLGAVMLRIMIREGFMAGFGLFLLVSLLYLFPIFFLDKFKRPGTI